MGLLILVSKWPLVILLFTSYSNVPTWFSWMTPEVFRIHPNNGRLEPSETCRLIATFSPDSAKVFSGHASCSFGEGNELNFLEHDLTNSKYRKVVKMEGIGKYPYVTVEIGSVSSSELESISECDKDISRSDLPPSKELKVNFGSVVVGQSAARWINVVNPSPVSGSYRCACFKAYFDLKDLSYCV